MNTPIFDFVKAYANAKNIRMHMPAHKGRCVLGCENLDVTEIDGADVLSCADGIIDESENNATKIFGSAKTFYTTEGSTTAIKAMITIANYVKKQDRLRVLAFRNAHKSFVYAMGMVDGQVEWFGASEHLCECVVDFERLETKLKTGRFDVLFVTSPNYLGNILDVGKLSQICKKYDVLLVVDNAHGAYLKFLQKSLHPIDLGADMCCDSAHKTLPTLTGGAYLHVSTSAPNFFSEYAKDALALFGSTSPSYLILNSLDLTNAYLLNGYSVSLGEFIKKLDLLKTTLKQHGYVTYGQERLKLSFLTKPFGYTGGELAKILIENNIYPEFYDDDFLVLMPTPDTSDDELNKLKNVMLSIPKSDKKLPPAPQPCKCERVMQVRNAVFSDCETVSVENALGRIVATPTISCPPAVCIVICGERLNSEAITALKYYGFNTVNVVKE
jgi:arginine/lysine/ornithine decarboxylase